MTLDRDVVVGEVISTVPVVVSSVVFEIHPRTGHRLLRKRFVFGRKGGTKTHYH